MELKEHGVRFLLSIMDGIDSHSFNDHVDYLIYMPTFYTSLQVADCHLLRSIFPDFSYSYYIMIHLPLSGYWDGYHVCFQFFPEEECIQLIQKGI